MRLDANDVIAASLHEVFFGYKVELYNFRNVGIEVIGVVLLIINGPCEFLQKKFCCIWNELFDRCIYLISLFSLGLNNMTPEVEHLVSALLNKVVLGNAS